MPASRASCGPYAQLLVALQLAVFEHSTHRPWAEEPDRYFAEVAGFLR